MLMRYVRGAAWTIGALTAAVLFFVGGFFLRLLMGPISLQPIAGAIEDSINSSITGLVVRFDTADLEWSRADDKVYLTVLGTKVLDMSGRIIAQAPKANLDFNVADLLAGHLRLKRFALVGVQLTGMRSQDGTIKLGFGVGQDDSDLLKTIREILQNNDSAGGTLDSISVRDARLAFRDEPSGLFVVSPSSNFTLDNRGGRLSASLDSAIEISGVPARVAVRARLRDDGMPEGGTIEIHGLSLPALSKNNPVLSYLEPYQVTSDGDASFELNEQGQLVTTTFRLSGTGTVAMAAFKTPLQFDNFQVTGKYDSAGEHFSLETVSLQGSPIAATGKATFALARKDGSFSAVSGEVDAQNVKLLVPEWFRQDLVLTSVSFKGGYDKQRNEITLERASLKGDALGIDASGSVSFDRVHSPAVKATGTLATLSVRDLLRYWPVGVGGGAYDWISSHVAEGAAGPFRVDVNFPYGVLDQDPLPDDALIMRFPFEQLTTRYLGALTPISEARGEATLTPNTFHAAVAAGTVGPIAVSSGDVMITNMNNPATASGRIRAHTESDAIEVLKLIDQEPLGYTRRFGIDSGTARGHAAVDLDFTVPMMKDVSVEQVRIGAQAKLMGLAIAIDEHRRLENGAVDLSIGSSSLTSRGTGEVSGVPVAFNWTEDFGPSTLTTRVDVSGRLDDTTRAKLGFTEPKWLKGSMPVTIGLTGRRFRFNEATVKADITNASAEFKTLNLEKRAGVPGTASAVVRFEDGGAISINNLVVAGQGLQARGAVSLDSAGRLIKVSLADMRSGPNNDFAVDVEPLKGGGLAIRMQGRSLDATKIFGDTEKAAPGAPPPPDRDVALKDPLSLNLKLDRILFKNDLEFQNVTATISLAGNDRITGFELEALGPSKGKMKGGFSNEQGVRTVTLEAEDAGTFIRAFTGFTSVRGGNLSARVSFPSDTVPPTQRVDYSGTVTLSDFVMTDQPFLARLFAAGSLDGPLRLLQGEGIAIRTMTAPFNAQGKIVTIHEGRAAGPAVGGTFEGLVDRRVDRIELTGTMVPAYGINSMLGAVPILGDILASRKGEGVFGVTYSMKGPLDDPSLNVNPLSVLTPGILRRIFEYAPPKAPPQAAVDPDPAQATPAQR